MSPGLDFLRIRTRLQHFFRAACSCIAGAREVLVIAGGQLAILVAFGAAFHAGYLLHLTHTHEVITSCTPVSAKYAALELYPTTFSDHCRAHDEAGRPFLFRFVVLDGAIFMIAALAAIEGLRAIIGPRPDLEQA